MTRVNPNTSLFLLQQFNTQIGTDESKLLHFPLPVGHPQGSLHHLALQGLRLPQHTRVEVDELFKAADEEVVQLLVCE